MNSDDLKKWMEVQVILTRVSGMTAQNQRELFNNECPYFDYNDFVRHADEIENIMNRPT